MLVAVLFASSMLALSSSCFETSGKAVRDLVPDLVLLVMGAKPADARSNAGADDARGKECGREDEAHEQATGRTQERPDSDVLPVS